MVQYFKLVRDLIPFIIEESGATCDFIVLDEVDYRAALIDKLNEEVAELIDAQKDTDAFIEEMADVLEVINALCDTRGITMEELERIRADKERKRGGFWQRLYLLTVNDD